jgi:hypothetical protein
VRLDSLFLRIHKSKIVCSESELCVNHALVLGDVVIIRLEDQGGGIAEPDLPEVAKFFRTSARLNTMSLYQGIRPSFSY